uniref:Uncharacterized protein n=1 Tax=Cacopsylla melanoneura TaxID=428564 RepID=A0A8D8SZC6_9HEMI
MEHLQEQLDEEFGQFRQYLESHGVRVALAKSLSNLKKEAERPANPVSFIVDQLQPDGPCAKEDRRIAELNQIIELLKEQIAMYEAKAKEEAEAAAKAKTEQDAEEAKNETAEGGNA